MNALDILFYADNLIFIIILYDKIWEITLVFLVNLSNNCTVLYYSFLSWYLQEMVIIAITARIFSWCSDVTFDLIAVRSSQVLHF